MPYGSKGPSNSPNSGPSSTPIPVNRRLPAPTAGPLPPFPANPNNQAPSRPGSAYSLPIQQKNTPPQATANPEKKEADSPYITGRQNDVLEKARSLTEVRRALHGPEVNLRSETAFMIYQALSEVLRGYILNEDRAQIANDLAETISHMNIQTWQMIEEAVIRTIDWRGRAIPKDIQTETLDKLKTVFSES